jgi:hypothetical protein
MVITASISSVPVPMGTSTAFWSAAIAATCLLLLVLGITAASNPLRSTVLLGKQQRTRLPSMRPWLAFLVLVASMIWCVAEPLFRGLCSYYSNLTKQSGAQKMRL